MQQHNAQQAPCNTKYIGSCSTTRSPRYHVEVHACDKSRGPAATGALVGRLDM